MQDRKLDSILYRGKTRVSRVAGVHNDWISMILAHWFDLSLSGMQHWPYLKIDLEFPLF